uniref:PDZ domain-containing protein n=1 Tax=Globodera rostochiensis TaxID=31243 RepID=A0A914HVR2_GLORO
MNASMPVPRLCVVEKPSGDCEYGFNLHAERGRGQFVGAVDIGSPADVSGLRPGDHIVAVNAEAVAGLSHKEVVHRIKTDPTRCSLLVLDEDSVQWYKEHNVPMFAYFARRPEELENEGQHYGGEEAAEFPLAEVSGSPRQIALPANDAAVADPTRVPAAQIAIGSSEESLAGDAGTGGQLGSGRVWPGMRGRVANWARGEFGRGCGDGWPIGLGESLAGDAGTGGQLGSGRVWPGMRGRVANWARGEFGRGCGDGWPIGLGESLAGDAGTGGQLGSGRVWLGMRGRVANWARGEFGWGCGDGWPIGLGESLAGDAGTGGQLGSGRVWLGMRGRVANWARGEFGWGCGDGWPIGLGESLAGDAGTGGQLGSGRVWPGMRGRVANWARGEFGRRCGDGWPIGLGESLAGDAGTGGQLGSGRVWLGMRGRVANWARGEFGWGCGDGWPIGLGESLAGDAGTGGQLGSGRVWPGMRGRVANWARGEFGRGCGDGEGFCPPVASICLFCVSLSPAFENLSPPVSILSADSASPATIPRHNRSQVEAAIPAQLQAAGPKPRLCTLIKPSPVEEFGFNLHAERGKGHFIGAVDKGGIADAAGLETGQRIVGVNDRLVSAQTPHKEIVQLIKRDPLKTVLLVASEEADRFYAEYGLVFSYDHLLLFDPLLQNGRNRLASNGSKQGQPQSSSNLRQQGTPNTLQEKEQKNGNHPRGMTLNERPPTPTSTYTATPPLSPPTIAVQIQVRADNRTDIQIKEVEDSLQHSPADQTLDNVSGERQNGKHVLAGYFPEAMVPSSYSQNDKIALSSELSHSSRRIPPEQKDHVCSNGAAERDIFALSALEARQLMRGRKRDPRKEGKMTLDEKYRLILNL